MREAPHLTCAVDPECRGAEGSALGGGGQRHLGTCMGQSPFPVREGLRKKCLGLVTWQGPECDSEYHG